jgi:hypothetical protein
VEVEATPTPSASEDDEPDIIIDEPTTNEQPEEKLEPVVADKSVPKEAAAPIVVSDDADKKTDEPKLDIKPSTDTPNLDSSPAVSVAAASAAVPATKSPTIDPVAEVISAAQAAGAAQKAEAEAPSVNSHDDMPDEAVAPALSKVVEVEVEETAALLEETNEEPQAKIDRAIKALDLEAEGKNGSDLIAEEKENSADEKKTSDKNADEPPAEVVEDEQVGGNGLTVFLLTAIILLGGAMGGAYWAWKEGYIDLGPLVEQLGLSGVVTNTPTTPQTSETPTDNQTAPTSDVPTNANVRDVTPNNPGSNADSSTSNTDSSAQTSDRLTAEPEVENPTETPTETTPTETEATTPETAETTPTETTSTTADGGDRLQAEEPANNTETPVLNTEDTSNQPTQVGSRSMLIEEQVAGAGGAVPFTGETSWSRGVDELGVPTIQATVTIPARNLSVDVLIRKNGDAGLPASHLVEVNFSVTESFLGGGIASMPGILLKNEELAQGTPLVGASARIFDNSFLFALSAAEGDLASNLAMLSERGWIDLPVVYSTGRKAIVTLEKGADGQSIFEAVLAAWAAQ